MPTRKMCRVVASSMAMIVAAALSACGAGGAAGPGEGIADEIKLMAVHDLTGPVAYAGVGANKGAKLAIQEINSSGYLGDGVEITMDEIDTAGEIDRASSSMAKVMADPEVSAVLGPTMGQQAAAVAPLVNKQKMPTVFTQSGSEGVVTGDYTFRATAPMESYYDVALQWLAEQGHKDLAVIYNGTYPTFAEMGKETVPSGAEDNGMTVSESVEVQDTTQSFTSQAQKIASSKPDAVVMLLTAPASVTFLSQLRQAGYDGQVSGTSVQAAGNVAEAGAAAEGLVYPVDYSTVMEHKAAQEFAKAFEKEYGEAPDAYAAEGYDAIWWIARAIKAEDDSSREGIQAGLEKVASEGFKGAMGDLTFDGNDMRVDGAMVEWAGNAEKLAK